MKKTTVTILLMLLCYGAAFAQTKTLQVTVTNQWKEDKKDEPEPVDQSDQNPPITPEPSDKKPFTFGRIWKTIEKMLSDESEGEDEKV